uniref:Translation machinery-associated protein 22 n=1 Tax=Salix viminalis TaxID=40686 RepID=A0A6N2L1F8_SALVM
MAEKPEPVKVLYCPICSLPAEYCEFGPDFEKCKPWLIINAPELYPDLLKEANEKEAERISEQLQFAGISSSGADGAISSVQSGETSSSKQEEVKRLPVMLLVILLDGLVQDAPDLHVQRYVKACLTARQEVVIEKVVRNKRKSITIIKGMELFGIKLSDASKKLGKKFATGASVVKGPTEKEQIDVQGDIAYDIVEFITETWPDVPETAIYFIEDGRKVPAA